MSEVGERWRGKFLGKVTDRGGEGEAGTGAVWDRVGCAEGVACKRGMILALDFEGARWRMIFG